MAPGSRTVLTCITPYPYLAAHSRARLKNARMPDMSAERRPSLTAAEGKADRVPFTAAARHRCTAVMGSGKGLADQAAWPRAASMPYG